MQIGTKTALFRKKNKPKNKSLKNSFRLGQRQSLNFPKQFVFYCRTIIIIIVGFDNKISWSCRDELPEITIEIPHIFQDCQTIDCNACCFCTLSSRLCSNSIIVHTICGNIDYLSVCLENGTGELNYCKVNNCRD